MLSEHQAYNSMVEFLDEIYERTHADSMGWLLSPMMILADGTTLDSGIWSDWIEATKKEVANNMMLSKHQAYNAMIEFLNTINKRDALDQLGWLLRGMMILEDGTTTDPIVWNNWLEAIEKGKDKIKYLELGRK